MIDRTRGYYDEAQETMPAARRAATHLDLLRETVRHAYENAPATRRKMDEAGVRPSDVKELADLRKIPFTRKADLKHIQKGEPPFGGLAAVPPRAMRRIARGGTAARPPKGGSPFWMCFRSAFFVRGILRRSASSRTSWGRTPAPSIFRRVAGACS